MNKIFCLTKNANIFFVKIMPYFATKEHIVILFCVEFMLFPKTEATHICIPGAPFTNTV